jgi:hypothetical protein
MFFLKQNADQQNRLEKHVLLLLEMDVGFLK